MKHPAIAQLLRWFDYEHLPPHLQKTSRQFSLVEHQVADELKGPEATACLRKLLEAKDCAVRATIDAHMEDGHG